MNPGDLERLVHTELRSLPLPRAPHTLLPRVMAAVQGRDARAREASGWFAWPRGWQAAALAAFSMLAAAAVVVLPEALGAAAENVTPLVAGPASRLAEISEFLLAAAEAGQLLWRTVLAPVANYVLAVVLVMCIACVALAAALNQVVLGKALE